LGRLDLYLNRKTFNMREAATRSEFQPHGGYMPTIPRFLLPVLFAVTALLGIPACHSQSASTPPESKLFSTFAEEAYSTYQLPGNGDLWPSCWSNDDNVYAANGDGTGFSSTFAAMRVGRISGALPNLTGTDVAGDVGKNYTGSNGYTDKPVGMLCVNGAIYLAFQNLNETDFEYAPAASIVVSTDHGATWSKPSEQPMFGNANNTDESVPALFTTIMFLDYGKDSQNAIDGYVYAYGFDNNWRDQQQVYLARVPRHAVLNRSAWEFFAGTQGNHPTWSRDITKKAPVITDTRLLYPVMFAGDCPANDKVIAQGGAVYDAPLHRYIFSSWSCSTHEFYEAPQPWGPWSHIAMSADSSDRSAEQPATTDFGPLRLSQNRGQYGTSIPSKFISHDGLTLQLQSNVCCGGDSYTFSLRKLQLEPYHRSFPVNGPSNFDLATAPGTRAISKSTHYGTLCGLDCSDQLSSGYANSEDDWDESIKQLDWWGYTWPCTYRFDQVRYRTGTIFPDGGWYASNLRVQVRQNFEWVDVPRQTISPEYPYTNAAGTQTTYTFNFEPTWGDGIRVIGAPGGEHTFTSISQLSVTYGATKHQVNLVQDPGFEQQATNVISSPWLIEGPDAHGIDFWAGFSHTGHNNAWIRDASSNWNAITQVISVQPNTNYTLSTWVQNNFTTNLGYFGIRDSGGFNVVAQTTYSAAPGYEQLTVKFNSGSNTTMTVFAGFWGQNTDYWTRFDDFSVYPHLENNKDPGCDCNRKDIGER
jgi:hypothetical protein